MQIIKNANRLLLCKWEEMNINVQLYLALGSWFSGITLGKVCIHSMCKVSLLKDVNALEAVQVRFTRLIPKIASVL